MVVCHRQGASPPSGGSGVVPPEKGEAVTESMSILAIALLVALLVIDRLAR